MKKSFLIIAAAALTLAACSKETRPAVDEGVVAFNTTVTKGAVATTANVSKIYVSAYNNDNTRFADGSALFSGIEFTKVGNTFTSTPRWYWPKKLTAAMKFAAFYPSLSDMGLTAANLNDTAYGSAVINGVVPNQNIANQKDIITATASGTTGVVSLAFNHRLSRIVVKAQESDNEYNYQIYGVRMANVFSKGNLNLSTGAFANLSDVTDYTVDFSANPVTVGATAVDLVAGNNCPMLLPQSRTNWKVGDAPDASGKYNFYIGLLVKITKASNNSVFFPSQALNNAAPSTWDWAVMLPDDNLVWEGGKEYTYTIDFTGGAGYVYPEKSKSIADNFPAGQLIFGNRGVSFSVKTDVADWASENRDAVAN